MQRLPFCRLTYITDFFVAGPALPPPPPPSPSSSSLHSGAFHLLHNEELPPARHRLPSRAALLWSCEQTALTAGVRRSRRGSDRARAPTGDSQGEEHQSVDEYSAAKRKQSTPSRDRVCPSKKTQLGLTARWKLRRRVVSHTEEGVRSLLVAAFLVSCFGKRATDFCHRGECELMQQREPQKPAAQARQILQWWEKLCVHWISLERWRQ